MEKTIGTCSECGRTLTNPVSIAMGVGPVCGGGGAGRGRKPKSRGGTRRGRGYGLGATGGGAGPLISPWAAEKKKKGGDPEEIDEQQPMVPVAPWAKLKDDKSVSIETMKG